MFIKNWTGRKLSTSSNLNTLTGSADSSQREYVHDLSDNISKVNIFLDLIDMNNFLKLHVRLQ